jgi:hypothetical protein
VPSPPRLLPRTRVYRLKPISRLRSVTIAITLISCVVIFGVNWFGVFGDIQQAITVIAGAIGVISWLVTWWTFPD